MGAIGCKNCGSYFTDDEMARLKPPMHPWPLTAVGQRIYDENRALGQDQVACPRCGCRTLRRAS